MKNNEFNKKMLFFALYLSAVGSLPMLVSPPVTANEPLSTRVSNLVKQVHPAIVNIKCFLPQVDSNPRARSGSGFIIDKDGCVVTNQHVVDCGGKIIVRLNNGRVYRAELIGSDKLADVALLKVEAENLLPVVEMGESTDGLMLGQKVFAIGSPHGLDGSVTKGIISGLNRRMPGGERYMQFIQTDTQINPGNSGGPLLDMKGKVIGINSLVYTYSGYRTGISFSIPIDDAMDVVNQLKKNGHVSRGWLGVIADDVHDDSGELFDLDYPHGALLNKVFPDTPGEKGGLQKGDIITRFNGCEIESASDLIIAVGHVSVDKYVVDIELVRDGDQKVITLAVGKLSDKDSDDFQSGSWFGSWFGSWLGSESDSGWNVQDSI